jgi:hypothetical protein
VHPESLCTAERAENRINGRKNIILRIERIIEEQQKIGQKVFCDLDIPHLYDDFQINQTKKMQKLRDAWIGLNPTTSS